LLATDRTVISAISMAVGEEKYARAFRIDRLGVALRRNESHGSARDAIGPGQWTEREADK
jgi:hypothetical protein